MLRMSFNFNKARVRRSPDRMAGAVRTFRSYLAQRGLRYTSQRRAVLAEVVGRIGHFDADELYEAFRAARRDVSRATVYRTLGHLGECGLVKELLQARGRARYETVYGIDHHDHMVCVRCGKVMEFCDERIEELQRRICRRHRFKPVEHRMAIRGVCRQCRAGKGGAGG